MDNISYISKIGRLLLLLGTLLEVIFFPEMENFVGCAVMIYGWFLFETFIFKRENFLCLFLPTVAVTGYIVMLFFLPLIMTLVEGKPLTYNFQVPYTMFFNQFLNISVIVLAFCWCKRVYHPNNILNRLWEKIGYFRPPSDNQLWCMAFICLIPFFITQMQVYRSVTTDFSYDDLQQGANGGGLMAIFQNLNIYFMLPICLFFRNQYGSICKKINKQNLIIYVIVILVVALISTKRSPIAKPIFSIAILYMLIVLIENRKVMSTKSFFKYAVIVILVGGPISNLAMAMVITRGQTKSFDTIIEYMKDGAEIHRQYKLMRDLSSNGGDYSYIWSRDYVDNVLFDRFCNLRDLDATLYYADKLGYDNPDMHKYMKDKFYSQLPSPIVSFMGEKKNASTTVADLMSDKFFNRNYFTINNKVGGDTGIGLYWLGYSYYPIALIIYFLVFYFLSTLVYTRQNLFIIPVPVIASLQGYFMYFGNANGIVSSIILLQRSGWLNVLIYCALFFVVRKFIK